MRVKLKPRKCRRCKAAFEPKVKWQEFCGKKCQVLFNSEKTAELVRKAIEAGL